MSRPKSYWILGAITQRGPVRLLVETSPPATLIFDTPGIFSPDWACAPVLGFLLETHGQLIKFETVHMASNAEANQSIPRHPDYDYTAGKDKVRLWVVPNNQDIPA